MGVMRALAHLAIAAALAGCLTGDVATEPRAEETTRPPPTIPEVERESRWSIDADPPVLDGKPGDSVAVRVVVRHPDPPPGSSVAVDSSWIVDGNASATHLSRETVLDFTLVLTTSGSLPVTVRDAEGRRIANLVGPSLRVDTSAAVTRPEDVTVGTADPQAEVFSFTSGASRLNITFAPPAPTASLRNESSPLRSQLTPAGPLYMIQEAAGSRLVGFVHQQVYDGQAVTGEPVERHSIEASLPAANTSHPIAITIFVAVACECDGPDVVRFDATLGRTPAADA